MKTSVKVKPTVLPSCKIKYILHFLVFSELIEKVDLIL